MNALADHLAELAQRVEEEAPIVVVEKDVRPAIPAGPRPGELHHRQLPGGTPQTRGGRQECRVAGLRPPVAL